MKSPQFSFMCTRRDAIGRRGEKVAAIYLQEKGFVILEMNYRNARGIQLGEIDIIAEKNEHIVFVEVKSRQGSIQKIFPEDGLTYGKFRKLEKIAAQYIQSHRLFGRPYHFDAIAIVFDQNKKAFVKHFEYIFF